MDKAYDSNTIRQFLAVQGIEVVIPSKANRTESIHIAWSAGDASGPGAVHATRTAVRSAQWLGKSFDSGDSARGA